MVATSARRLRRHRRRSSRLVLAAFRRSVRVLRHLLLEWNPAPQQRRVGNREGRQMAGQGQQRDGCELGARWRSAASTRCRRRA